MDFILFYFYKGFYLWNHDSITNDILLLFSKYVLQFMVSECHGFKIESVDLFVTTSRHWKSIRNQSVSLDINEW